MSQAIMNESNDLPVDLKWDVRQRLILLEANCLLTGRLQTNDLQAIFGIKRVQASRDISRYRAMRPNNLRYDPSQRCYLASDEFDPVFLPDTSGNTLLSALRCARSPLAVILLRTPPVTAHVEPRGPAIDLPVVRHVVRAIVHKEALEVTLEQHHDKNQDVIWPHTLVWNGYRWHARCYSEQAGAFTDIPLHSIIKAAPPLPRGQGGEEQYGAQADGAWKEQLTLTLAPADSLDQAKRNEVMNHYGMRDERLELTMPLAMLRDTLRFFHLPVTTAKGKLGNQELQVANEEAVRQALQKI
jgi:predicted DNA-binding transcriptional regulator YafY